MTSRSFVFTINNWTPQESADIEDTECRYLIFGYEEGEIEKTPHIQGYIEFATPIRQSAVQKLKGFARAYIRARRGTRDQAREYCMKNNEYTEKGDWTAGGQGTRNDLKKLMESIRDNSMTTREIMEENPNEYARNIRFAEKYQAIIERDETREFREVETDLFIGDAGTGKSRKARELYPEAFTVNPEDSFPFDGYDGEKEIIIDDFEGQLKYKHLLKILDGHQLRINVKGSHRYARWTKVVITTNEPAERWYQRGLTPALQRRITRVTEFRHEEAGNSMPPQENDIAI